MHGFRRAIAVRRATAFRVGCSDCRRTWRERGLGLPHPERRVHHGVEADHLNRTVPPGLLDVKSPSLIGARPKASSAAICVRAPAAPAVRRGPANGVSEPGGHNTHSATPCTSPLHGQCSRWLPQTTDAARPAGVSASDSTLKVATAGWHRLSVPRETLPDSYFGGHNWNELIARHRYLGARGPSRTLDLGGPCRVAEGEPHGCPYMGGRNIVVSLVGDRTFSCSHIGGYEATTRRRALPASGDEYTQTLSINIGGRKTSCTESALYSLQG